MRVLLRRGLLAALLAVLMVATGAVLMPVDPAVPPASVAGR